MVNSESSLVKKVFDSKENHIIPKKYDLLALVPPRKKDVPINRTKGENRKRHLPEEYNGRPMVDTVHFVIKRKNGSLVRSRISVQFEKEIPRLTIITFSKPILL